VQGRPDLAAKREAARKRPGTPEEAQVVAELGNTWTTDFQALQASKGVEHLTLLPKKGDVVIWHSLLAHGGSRRINRSLSRRSVVFHYIGANSRLYTYQQFFLLNRHELLQAPPQAVPLEKYKGVRYMRYGYYVSYADGKEHVHNVG
jgi:ectoine hydroxylase-related dioxygenase (phytanoyl-CoA dioxygenase family)